jgi:hypothetical protein
MAKHVTDGKMRNEAPGWVLVRIERGSERVAEHIVPAALNSSAPTVHLFEHSQDSSFAERFPRLTVFGVACGLLAIALIAEIDCLRDAGYFWR